MTRAGCLIARDRQNDERTPLQAGRSATGRRDAQPSVHKRPGRATKRSTANPAPGAGRLVATDPCGARQWVSRDCRHCRDCRHWGESGSASAMWRMADGGGICPLAAAFLICELTLSTLSSPRTQRCLDVAVQRSVLKESLDARIVEYSGRHRSTGVIRHDGSTGQRTGQTLHVRRAPLNSEGFAIDIGIIRADASPARSVPGAAPIDWGRVNGQNGAVREYLEA